MQRDDSETMSGARHGGRWTRSVIAVIAASAAGVGFAGAASGQDITPWRVCEAASMPVAVDFGGLAAPTLVHDAPTEDALLHAAGDDPGCAVYSLPAGI